MLIAWRTLKARLRKYKIVRAKRLPDVKYNDTADIDRFIFICGLQRSGTTLLERLLVSKYELSCLRASTPESEGEHIQSVFTAALRFGGAGRFAFSTEALEELNRLDDYPAHRAAILDAWRPFVVGDSPTLVEKSPPNLTKIPWLRKVFPGSQFIIMTRDPRAVAGATQKWSMTTLPELMMHWNVAYSQALEDFDESDCITVRYEDLIDHSETELERLGQFLNLTPRTEHLEIEARHQKLVNMNGKYIAAHGGTRYGEGVWNRFGYTC
ncbi:hypothetical protein CKO11_01375 [Rhodobacter sp. TJ_12]|uniref:sulfotransferase family protein n=1 Tax=Rhodobacter sp. TJ_12 TaxID=2029399 RepID=UPI001CC16FFE|nr:sulfotransferase [Rhodobacter sp. TJ_12]MBZ4021113.1 hypothetical protein [Rhodobacter sp. TJ_12]